MEVCVEAINPSVEEGYVGFCKVGASEEEGKTSVYELGYEHTHFDWSELLRFLVFFDPHYKAH